MSASHQQITASLLKLNERIEGDVLIPALFPAATDLVQTDPYAFCLATCLNRGTKAQIIWTIPYWIRDNLGLTPDMRHDAAEVYRLVTDTELNPCTPEDPRLLPGLQEIIVALARIMCYLWFMWFPDLFERGLTHEYHSGHPGFAAQG